MTNKERQKQLDKQKWIESENKGEDMSGMMPYCAYCEYQDSDLIYSGKIVRWCTCEPQEERTTKCYCATAYNRLVRQLSKNT